MKRRSRKKRELAEDGNHEPQSELEDTVEDEEASIDVTALREERDALEDKLKRALADMANMRRRAADDARRATDNALGRVAQELLPIMDSFQLALSAEGDRDSLLEGVKMVHAMLEDLLGRHGVEPIPALDGPFDPQLHEAMAVVERDDVPAGTVIAVQQNGFKIGDRVLRPARVVVSQEAPEPSPDESGEEANDESTDAGREPEETPGGGE